jgi:hypothetical protein
VATGPEGSPAHTDETLETVSGNVRGNVPGGAGGARVRRRLDAVASRGRRAASAVEGRVESPLHDRWVASVLGIALGVAFTVCFLTGLVDYLSQHPPSWFHLPTHPVNLYGVNEAVHVTTGIACIPLLLAKLWTVWPKLFAWPPVRDVANLLERISLIALVGGSLFQLFTGVVNIDYWYSPMPFFFPVAHFWVAWMVMGALVVHVGAKALTAAHAIAAGPSPRPGDDEAGTDAPRVPRPGLSRRGFIGATVATSGVLVVTFVGEAVSPLRTLALLAPRNPVVGPQSVPVNQTALQAGVTASARDPGFALEVVGDCRHPQAFTLAALRAMPQRSAGLPITCVEGWIAPAQWRGVSLPLLLKTVGAPPGASVRVESLEDQSRLYSASVVDRYHAADENTLLAMELNGEVLDVDHGYPVRLIAPDRPGVLQTKWVTRVVVL